MKHLYMIIFAAVFSLDASAGDVNNGVMRLTAGEALKECKKTIATHNNTKEFKFKRKPATRYKAGKYTFWINFSTLEQGKKDIGRAKCILSKEGELVSLDLEGGRWNM